MVVPIQTRQAYSEVDEFLELLSEEKRNEIPQKIRQFFKEEKDKEYVKNIKEDIPIKDQNLKEETLAIIAILNLQYWCKDEEEKKRLKQIYYKNEIKYQENLYKKYNPDIFNRERKNVIENDIRTKENMQILEYKESIFRKILNRLLRFFRIKYKNI